MTNLKTFLVGIFCLFGCSAAFAIDHNYTNDDEWTAYEAFHNTYWCTTYRNYKADTAQPNAGHRGNGNRDNDLSGCHAAIWCQAIYFDMAVNAYKRRLEDPNTSSSELRKAKNRMTTVYSGEKAHFVNFNFDDPNTNTGWFVYDDIMWWTAALARAYAVSVEAGSPIPEYLLNSEKSFCRVWYGSKKVGDDGSYADPAKGFTGGMFWEWQPISHANPHKDTDFKSACINFPTVIACCTLHDIVPDDRTAPTDEYPTYQTRDFYLEKAKEIYAWAKDHFCRSEYPGRVADGIHGGGPEWGDHLYNQATYIGASCLLYKLTGDEQYLTNAREGADYVKNKMCVNRRGTRVLPVEKGYEQGVYAAIFAQYIKLLIDDCSQEDYRSWIEDNIQYGWQNRDQLRDLNDHDFYTAATADQVIESYGASALPALMIQFPVKTDDDAAVGTVTTTGKKKVAYAVDGKALSHKEKGLYIVDGKKYIAK